MVTSSHAACKNAVCISTSVDTHSSYFLQCDSSQSEFCFKVQSYQGRGTLWRKRKVFHMSAVSFDDQILKGKTEKKLALQGSLCCERKIKNPPSEEISRITACSRTKKKNSPFNTNCLVPSESECSRTLSFHAIQSSVNVHNMEGTYTRSEHAKDMVHTLELLL